MPPVVFCCCCWCRRNHLSRLSAALFSHLSFQCMLALNNFSSTVFAIGHGYEGSAGLVTVGLMGAVFALGAEYPVRAAGCLHGGHPSFKTLSASSCYPC